MFLNDMFSVTGSRYSYINLPDITKFSIYLHKELLVAYRLLKC